MPAPRTSKTVRIIGVILRAGAVSCASKSMLGCCALGWWTRAPKSRSSARLDGNSPRLHSSSGAGCVCLGGRVLGAARCGFVGVCVGCGTPGGADHVFEEIGVRVRVGGV